MILVEDEALVAMMMEDLLEELGCEIVASFGSLAPALEWLRSGKSQIDGALLDVNLGGGENVFPLAAALRELGVPFAFATGYGVLPESGFAEATVLQKPVDLGMLWPVVEAFRPAA